MEGQQRNSEVHDGDTAEDVAAAIKATDSILDIHLPDSPSPSSSCSPLPASASASALLALASPATRRSISMGDFRRVTGALLARSEPPSTSATAPSSKLVTPSSSMEFEAARRRLLEVEERQRVIREMERRLEELREMFVRSEQQVVLHGELVTRISSAAQQGELYVAENGQRLKKGLKFKKHRPTIIFSSMLGLRTCLPWPVKLFRDYSSSTLAPNFRPQPRKSRTAGKQFMLGHFHLWPLFIQSPSNHSSLHLKADSTHAYDASR
uniref:Si:ch211-160f23.7 n=1 Tax=Oryzias sinensis TaxID=183150 RepID=A0A8C8E1K4_9TELE